MSNFRNFDMDISLDENTAVKGVITSKKNNKEIIICVHGFAGSANNITNFNLAKTIQKYDCPQDLFRFTAYSAAPEGRHFFQLTMAQQAKDLDSIISLVKNKYEKIHIFANSLGVIPVSMLDTTQLSSIFLMDPAFVVASIWASKSIIPVTDDNGNKYLMNLGMPGLDLPFCVSLEHKEEGLSFTPERGIELLTRFKVPTFIASAGKSEHGKATRQLLKMMPKNPNIWHQQFSNADHRFSNENENRKLLDCYMEVLKSIAR